MKFSLFKADNEADLRQIFELRYRVYIVEQGKCGGSDRFVSEMYSDPLDASAIAQIGVKHADGSLLGAVRINSLNRDVGSFFRAWAFLDALDFRRCFYVSRLVIRPGWRRSRVLPMLMMEVIRECTSEGVHVVILNCSERYMSLYRKFGFSVCSEPFLDDVAGWQYPMALDVSTSGSSGSSGFRRFNSLARLEGDHVC